MLRTRLCDVLGIDVPVIQAGMSIFTSRIVAGAEHVLRQAANLLS